CPPRRGGQDATVSRTGGPAASKPTTPSLRATPPRRGGERVVLTALLVEEGGTRQCRGGWSAAFQTRLLSELRRHCPVLLARGLEALERELDRHPLERRGKHHQMRLPAGAGPGYVLAVRDGDRERQASAA